MPTDASVNVAVVGVGHRGVGYAEYALSHPDRMRVVAVADPNEHRRTAFAETHQVAAEKRFASYEDLIAHPKGVDAVINATMDRLHYESTTALLNAGFDVLLEKPIASTEAQVLDLGETAQRTGKTLMICHVLRYAPFYREVKRLLDAGTIGRFFAIHTSENVSYHHMATAFVRGRWNRREVNPIMLAKCCHDLDLLAWLMSGVTPIRVSSFGARSHFRLEQAPQGSAERCMNGCAIESTCPYSARKMYVVQDLWSPYAWESIEEVEKPTDTQKLESLRTDNPMGRCVWRCDNDAVDHQMVQVEFADGTTATHNLLTNTSRPTRTIHIIGAAGELFGDFEAGTVTLRRHDPGAAGHFTEQIIDVNVAGGGGQGGHGGGDTRLIDDFISSLRHEPTSPGATRIQDSLTGHRLAFAADTAMREHRVVTLTPEK